MRPVYETLGPEGYGSYWVDWDSGKPLYERVEKAPEVLLVPGLIDLHCHGAFGLDWMELSEGGPEACQKGLRTLADRFEQLGIEGFLPTTVTNPVEAIKKALSGLPQDDPRILGFHLEGPFISPEFPGAQPQVWIQDPPDGDSEWSPILDHPALKIVTLAPERPRALDLILMLQKRGVRVSLGHTNSTHEEMRRGVEFGATHVTHTFNAMRGLHHREAGALGYVLLNPNLYAELIYDRVHVCKEAAQILIQSRPMDKLIGISDSSAATGLTRGTNLTLWGQPATVGNGDVRLQDGTLAGSAVALDDVFRNLAEDFGRELAIYACSINPRRALGLTRPPRFLVEMNLQMDLVGIRPLS